MPTVSQFKWGTRPLPTEVLDVLPKWGTINQSTTPPLCRSDRGDLHCSGPAVTPIHQQYNISWIFHMDQVTNKVWFPYHNNLSSYTPINQNHSVSKDEPRLKTNHVIKSLAILRSFPFYKYKHESQLENGACSFKFPSPFNLHDKHACQSNMTNYLLDPFK